MIDPTGKAVLSHPGGNDAGIGRLKNGLFVKRTGESRTVVTLDGQVVLAGCSDFNWHADTLFFHCSEKFGYRLPDGTVGDLGAKYFKTEQKTPFGEIVQLDIAGRGIGFRGLDDRLLAEPKKDRQISAGPEWGPFVDVVDFKKGRPAHTIIDARSGEKVPLEPFDYSAKIEELGWLLIKNDGNGDRKAVFLCNLEFGQARPVPLNWNIEKDWQTGCFSVTDYSSGELLGHIARNGKVLFED